MTLNEARDTLMRKYPGRQVVILAECTGGGCAESTTTFGAYVYSVADHWSGSRVVCRADASTLDGLLAAIDEQMPRLRDESVSVVDEPAAADGE